MKFNTFIFDFDGTIADTNDIILQSWQHTYRTLTGKEENPDVIQSRYGEPLRESMEQAFPDVDPYEAMELYRNYQAEIFEDCVTEFPHVTKVLKELKAAGKQLVILTSRQRDFTMRGLDKMGVTELFDAIITCDETDAHKPDPEPMYRALKASGASEEESVMIGDSRFDIMCAHRAGVKGALVAWSVAQPVAPSEGEAKPDYIIKEMEDILEFC